MYLARWAFLGRVGAQQLAQHPLPQVFGPLACPQSPLAHLQAGPVSCNPLRRVRPMRDMCVKASADGVQFRVCRCRWQLPGC